MGKWTTPLLFILCFGVVSKVYAAQSYRVNAGQTVWIYEFGTGRMVRNTGSTDIFVPTNTSGEWSAFIANKPAYVTLISCPTNYVGVPADTTNITTPYCMMTYEAKNVSGVPTSQAAVIPWTSVAITTARTACQAIGTGYDIPTNAQYQAIAQNVELVPGNWSTGTVGSGCLRQGNINTTYSGCSYFTGSAEFGTGRNTLASMTLSTGQVIWDLNGNVHERNIPMTDPTGSAGVITIEANKVTGTPKTLWGPKGTYTSGCGTDPSGTCGMGWMQYRVAPNTSTIRSGAFDNNWGIFAMHSGYADGVDPTVGFRCVYNP